MFRELRSGDSTQFLDEAAEDRRMTMLIGRGSAQFLVMLSNVGNRPDRATFFIHDSDVIGEGQGERWFGNDDSIMVVLLDYDSPKRNAVKRYTEDAFPADIVDDVLQLEADQNHEEEL